MTDAAPPILPSPPAPPPSRAGTLLRDFKAHAVRAFRPRWGGSVAWPEERAILTAPRVYVRPVSGREAQDYVAWRRSLCVVAFWTLAVTTLVSLVLLIVDLTKLDDGGMLNPSLAGFLDVVRFLGTQMLPLAMLWLAMRGWHDLRWSHRRLVWGWAGCLAVTFGLALFPVAWLMRRGEGVDEAVASAIEKGAGLLVGFVYILLLLPAVLSVLVGAIRSSMAVKRFLPEAALPGWVAAAAGPILALLILVLAALFAQITGSVLMTVGALALIAKYLLPLKHARVVVAPTTRAELDAVLAPMTLQGRVLGAIGGVLLLVGFFTFDLLGRQFVGFGEGAVFSPFHVLLLVLDFTAKAIVAAIVFSDWLIAVLRFSWSEANSFRVSPLVAPFQESLEQLDKAGIADLGASAAMSAPPTA
jgi:hypothetical protein